MAVTNLYSNLPGHLVEFKDGGLQLTSSTTDTSATKSLLILGTATDGPVFEPVKIDANTVSQVFGKEVNADGYPNGATITKYAKQAFKNGFDDVRCMRVTGSQAYTTITGQKVVEYEEITETISGDSASVSADEGKVQGVKGITLEFDKVNNQYFKTGVNGFFACKDASMGTLNIDGTDEQLSTRGITFNQYSGITIPNDTFLSIMDFHIHFTGFEFVKTDADKVDPEGNITTGDSLLYKKTGTQAISLANATDDPADVVISLPYATVSNIFDDENAHINDVRPAATTPGWNAPNNENLPIFQTVDNNGAASTDWNNGVRIKIQGGSSYLDPASYTVTTVASDPDNNTDGSITISFAGINGGTNPVIADGDTFEIEYYPIKDIEVNSDLKDIFTDAIEDIDRTYINITNAITNNYKNMTVSFMHSDGTATGKAPIVNNGTGFSSSEAEITNGELVIKDLTGLTPGDIVIVTYKYDRPISTDMELKIKSQFGGSIYKDGTVEVKKVTDGTETYTEIVFTKPTAKSTTQATRTYSYSSKYYPTVDDLILAMKNDSNNVNMFEIEIVKGEGTSLIDTLAATAAKALDQGGEDGIKPTNNEMFIALSGERYTAADIGSPINSYSSEVVTSDMVGYLKTQGAYQILENYNVDYIYPAGVYADSEQTVNPYSDFQRELALVCAVLTYRTKMTHGFIDVKPNSNTTMVGIDAYVAKLINSHNNIYYMTDQNGDVIYDSENKPMDIGWYTSVVVGPEVVMTSDALGTYYGSPAIAYAALNAVLEPQSSPLNKALRNVNGMKFKFSNKQADAIIGNRMVCFKLKNEGLATASSTPYIVDGITAGAPGCDYANIVTVKVVTDVVDNIRQVADPFIGEDNTTEQRNALSALISKRLAKLVEIGEIKRYEFEISATIQQQLLGEASIALTVVPAQTLKRITTVVALRAAE